MNIIGTSLDGVYIIEPSVFDDSRGWFMETFRDDVLQNLGIHIDFIQDNHSMSEFKGTLRGIHFQNFPYAQTKLVRCIRGEILDIAVDLRKDSPNFKKWVGIVLSQENKKQLLIPRGFGHAFLTLTDNTEVVYKVDDYYSKAHDRVVRYDDSDINIDWGCAKKIFLSDKDRNASLLSNSDCNFDAKMLVTGAKGQLGYDVIKLLQNKSIPCLGVDANDFDLTDTCAIRRFVEDYKPTAIIHCAAYTAVDAAEDDDRVCMAVNAIGTKNLAEVAKKTGAKFLYISTDYVYGGNGESPQSESNKPNPLNVYGRSKLMGEQEVIKAVKEYFILRTSWVFGKNGNNFVATMLRLAKEKPELNIVHDQTGSPTYTVDLAHTILDIVFSDKYGIYNVTNEGFCSWKELSEEIFAQAGLTVKVKPVSSEEFLTKAMRPKNSRLDKSKLEQNGFKRLPKWQDALRRYLKEIEK